MGVPRHPTTANETYLFMYHAWNTIYDFRDKNDTISWLPSYQTRAHPPSPGKVVKCFAASVMTEKCSVDELFIHYFLNIRRHRGSVYRPGWGTEVLDP